MRPTRRLEPSSSVCHDLLTNFSVTERCLAADDYDSDLEENMSQLEYVLVDLPEGYTLYEHRRELDPNQPEGKGKGKDRREFFLYGHPGGRRKRYKTPVEFLPHLVWLATDESGDPENCGCLVCTPNDMTAAADELLALQAGPSEVQDRSSEKATTPFAMVPPGLYFGTPSPPAPASSGKKYFKEDLSRSEAANFKLPMEPSKMPASLTQAMSASKEPASNAPPAPIAPTNTSSMDPTKPVPARSAEQSLDAQPNKFIYRPGEVVWHLRSGRQEGAVGLAMITAREMFKNAQNQWYPVYMVQPLSHPYSHPRPLLVQDQRSLRPYLAFSTPEPFHQSLRNMIIPFERVDWRAVLEGTYGKGDTEADASMFAAKAVDASYTPIEPIPNATSDTPSSGKVNEIYYNGLYFGCEKFWVGEAVRLQRTAAASTGANTDILIISAIVERLATGQHSTADVLVVGDVYSYQTVAHNPKKPIPPNHYLPTRVQRDLEFRNAASAPKVGRVGKWKLVQPRARVSIADVKGRWYESRTMMPIISGVEYLRSSVEAGSVGDVGDSINARGDSAPASAPVKVGERKGNRLQAFGLAVPRGTQVGGKITPTPKQPPTPTQARTQTPTRAQAPTQAPSQPQPAQPLKRPHDQISSGRQAPSVPQTEQPAATHDTEMTEAGEKADYSQGYLGKLGTGGQF